MKSEHGDPDDAFINTISQQVDGIVTAFAVLVKFVGHEGETRVYFDSMRGQSAADTLGLLEYAKAIEVKHVQQAWLDDDEG